MYLIKVFITPQKSVHDPEGDTIKKSLHELGETVVQNVRIGKYIELIIDENSSDKALQAAKRIIEKLLVNPVTESYSFEIEECEE